MNEELKLLERAGLIEFSKITENSKNEPSLFCENEVDWGDLNPCQSGDVTRFSIFYVLI
jgi:hypothetical protein